MIGRLFVSGMILSFPWSWRGNIRLQLGVQAIHNKMYTAIVLLLFENLLLVRLEVTIC